MVAKKSTQSFEHQLARLEEIVVLLDKGDSSMEDMLTLYEEGIAITRSCREFIDKAEQRITNLTDIA
ncbi:MAG: exodeoxyribonuclease VII small subunit [Ignavibacteria bacterium]|nr:exodeoxyribonuclease VII small subunit [Ignavibacteria bacterium]